MMLDGQLAVVVGIAFFLYLTPLLFIFADLWAGIRKARERGEVITSYKSRRTIYKLNRYYNSLLALSVLDALQMVVLWYLHTYHGWHLPLLPVFTFIGAAGIGLIEVKSILEPATEKERKQSQQVADLARKLLADKDDPIKLAQDVSEFIANEKDK